MEQYDAVELFAGPGGWSIAARALGLDTIGFESDPNAFVTRVSARLRTRRGDVRDRDPLDFPATGLIASPPCQTFSLAGDGVGLMDLDLIIENLKAMVDGGTLHRFSDDRTGLITEPMRWIRANYRNGTPYQWIVMEQVPTVLTVWNAYADLLDRMGYTAIAGIVSSEQYGVPQVRRRAILMASRGEIDWPVATHSKFYPTDPERLDEGVSPWLTMGDVLNHWEHDLIDGHPRFPATGNHPFGGVQTRGVDMAPVHLDTSDVRRTGRVRERLWEPSFVGATIPDAEWPFKRPSTTVIGRNVVPSPGGNRNDVNGAEKSRNDGVRLTQHEAALIQGFPPHYPFRGSQTQVFQQIGNAVPPPMAEAILRGVLS